MRRMLATLAVGIAGGMIGALLVTAVPATGSPGDPLILSAVNQAGPMTVLKSNGGFRILAKNPARPPLMVYTPDSMPPLQVSSPAKVANLNVDLLDGLDSTAFAPASRIPIAAFASGDQSFEVPTFTEEVVRSVSLTPPVAGKVLVTSSANVIESTAGDGVSCSISNSAYFDNTHAQWWESAGANGSTGQIAGTRGFPVAGGVPFTAYLVCRHGGVSSSSTVADSSLTAVFVPNP